MTKRERVMAALRGAPVDRVPVSLWLHYFATETSAETLGTETPIIWTVFSPLMVLPFLLTGGRPTVLSLMRSEPAAVDHALGTMAETLAAYARAAVAEGADGLF